MVAFCDEAIFRFRRIQFLLRDRQSRRFRKSRPALLSDGEVRKHNDKTNRHGLDGLVTHEHRLLRIRIGMLSIHAFQPCLAIGMYGRGGANSNPIVVNEVHAIAGEEKCIT